MTDPHQPPEDEQTLPLGQAPTPEGERTLPQARAPAGALSEQTLPLARAPARTELPERAVVEGRLAELRYAAQMCAAEQVSVPVGALEELRDLEAQLKKLRGQ